MTAAPRAPGKERAPSKDERTDTGRVAAVGGWLRAAFIHNGALKFVALVLSITLFILVNTNKDAVIGVNVRVAYTMPEDRVLISDQVPQVRVTIKGSWRRLKRFDEREIERINVDLTNLQGGEYTIPEDAIKLPPGLKVLSINPPSIPLSFEPMDQKIVPVHVPTIGHPVRGYKLDSIVVKPSQVTIRGAASFIAGTERLSTRELSLDGKRTTFVENLPLVSPLRAPIIQIVDSGPVEVTVKIAEEFGTARIEDVPVALRLAPGFEGPLKDGFRTKPDMVDVVLHGPLLDVEAFDGEFVAFVEVTAEDNQGRPRPADVRIESPPDGLGVAVEPETVTLILRRD